VLKTEEKTQQKNTIVKRRSPGLVQILYTGFSTPGNSDDTIITDTQAGPSSPADVSEESTTLQQLENLCTIAHPAVAFGDSLNFIYSYSTTDNKTTLEKLSMVTLRTINDFLWDMMKEDLT